MFKVGCALQCATDLEHLYRIYSIPNHDKHQWLLLQFIVLLMMKARASETSRAYLQLLINTILPELHLVGLLYITYSLTSVQLCTFTSGRDLILTNHYIASLKITPGNLQLEFCPHRSIGAAVEEYENIQCNIHGNVNFYRFFCLLARTVNLIQDMERYKTDSIPLYVYRKGSHGC